ncbi:MAG: hypothetical protein IPK01_14315 [Acidobacteria bacterium]|nr:hypothetical protein [Acidobacteriota bacterium]
MKAFFGRELAKAAIVQPGMYAKRPYSVRASAKTRGESGREYPCYGGRQKS